MKITIETIKERRVVIEEVRRFDRESGVSKTQYAKHDKPNWWFICQVLPGVDCQYGLSINGIQDAVLAKFGITIEYISIRHCIGWLQKLDESIHPHRRNIGIDCYTMVRRLGGILAHTCSDRHGVGRPVGLVYSFGKRSANVNYYRNLLAGL